MSGARYVVLQWRAVSAVSDAMAKGILPRLSKSNIPCVDCGKRATDYDHRDYRTPLIVEPTCHRCNILRGPAKISDARPLVKLRKKVSGDIRLTIWLRMKHKPMLDAAAKRLDLSRSEVIEIALNEYFSKQEQKP